jgi:hypothetical protein
MEACPLSRTRPDEDFPETDLDSQTYQCAAQSHNCCEAVYYL